MESLAPDSMQHQWVLDKGECALLAVFGDDKMIADTARVSYRKGTKQSSTDAQLIRYLLRNKHTGPFEHASVRFYLKAPLFVIQQLLRHRTFKFNQASARYSEMLNEAYVPLPEHVTTQDAKNKQARTDIKVKDSHQIVEAMQAESDHNFTMYNSYLDEGVAREIARVNVPHGTYSEIIVTADIHNLMHFLNLRLHAHAQYEIRVFAEAMRDMVAPLFPATFAAFDDCILRSVTLTGQMQTGLTEVLDRLVAFGNYQTDEDEERAKAYALDKAIASVGWHSKSEKDQFASWIGGLLSPVKE